MLHLASGKSLLAQPTPMEWLLVPKQKRPSVAWFYRKAKQMQAYQHISVRGNRGVLTFCSSRPNEKLVVLGGSCTISANSADGPVVSFVAVPKKSTEVVAVAVEEVYPKHKLVEAFILGITFENGKAGVDLQVPYGGMPKAVGQMIINDHCCQLRVIEGEKTRLSFPWSVSRLDPTVGTPTEKVEGESFDELCKVLVEADKDEIVRVLLLNADRSIPDPKVAVNAIAVGSIYEFSGHFSRLISVCPGQGVAYERQVLTAYWDEDCWHVDHPAN